MGKTSYGGSRFTTERLAATLRDMHARHNGQSGGHLAAFDQNQQAVMAEQKRQRDAAAQQEIRDSLISSLYGSDPRGLATARLAAAYDPEGFGDSLTAAHGRNQLMAAADTHSLQGRERLAYLSNPEEYGAQLSTNYAAATVSPGAERVYGDGRDPYRNRDDLGYAELGETTRSNMAGEALRGGELNETIRSNQAGEALTGYSNATGRMNAVTSRRSAEAAARQAEAEGAMGGKRGLSPIYGLDADGNPVIAQLTSTGQLAPAVTPDGFTPLGPEGKALRSARGRELGKGEAERTLRLPAQARQLETFRADFGALTDRVELAKEQVSRWNTGPAAQYNPLATDLDATLETIRANAGFDKLQEMRDNSPTGGAVGQVSNIELRGLQSAWGNVQRSQSPGQLRDNLDAFQQRYEGMLGRMENAYREDMEAGLYGAPDPRDRGRDAPPPPPGFMLD